MTLLAGLLLTAGLLLVTASAALAAAPGVTVTPTSGDSGAGLTVAGSGWTPSDTIDVEIGGAEVCRLTADVSGEVNGTQADGCEVPSGLSSGGQALTAQDLTDGTTQATGSPFTVTPVASFSAPGSIDYGMPVILDASQSQGSITRYVWGFGDGTPTETTTAPTTSHQYAAVGTYTVSLTVVDASGNTDSAAQSVQVTDAPPAAAFTAPATEPSGTALNFDGTSSSDPDESITGYSWNFGDGTTSTLAQPAHSYSAPGTYPVTLSVTDTAGLVASVTHNVTVAGPLAAAFDPNAATVLAGSSVAFDATGSTDPSGDIESYVWSFGDGSSATGVQTSHKYLNIGTFDVTLTVRDNFGRADSVMHQITVIAPPPLQTLILTPVATPAIVAWAPVLTRRSGLVDLGERLFCPGPGPGCTASVTAISKSLRQHSGPAHRWTGIVAGSARAAPVAGRATISIAPSGSAELTVKLSRRALASLKKHGRLPARVKVTVVRANQVVISTLSLVFRLR